MSELITGRFQIVDTDGRVIRTVTVVDEWDDEGNLISHQETEGSDGLCAD